AVLKTYKDTLVHTSDADVGHLLRHPQSTLDRESVRSNVSQMRRECPQPGDLLYVEFDRPPAEAGAKIIGTGHHSRHRRIYLDSIHLSGSHQEDSYKRLRNILCPGPLELKKRHDGDHASAPQELTAARGLFGYVCQDREQYSPTAPNEPLAFGIGDGDFRQ